ncbi:ankyrin repeat domain-containing protein 23 [Neodiprion pinetum]|uniref:ankyrin repeat domain-containing protein 23 n=1 Tax=Neodiprion pinetum TaxID=441929 RepID=UPI00371A379F
MEANEMNRASTSEENPGSKKVAKSQLNRKLMDACTNRDVNTARKVILQGANVNHRTSHDVTPILVAAEHGDLDLIVLLCSQPNCTVDLQQKTIHGATPLHLTVFFGHRQAMLELLRRGASTVCWDNLGRYPLHFAVTQKDVGAARVLLKYGAPVNVYDTFFESPLYNSVMRKPCVAMAKLLLANG